MIVTVEREEPHRSDWRVDNLNRIMININGYNIQH
jgi:hypothetical protein